MSAHSGVAFDLVGLKKTREVFGEEAYEGKVQYTGPLRHSMGPLKHRALPRVKLDITFYEQVLFPTKKRPLIHSYSDGHMCTRELEVYRIEEIVAEKLRSLLQRTRPRDVYDLWHLLSQRGLELDMHQIVSGFHQKCKYKSVPFTGIEEFFDEEKIESYANAWESTLGHQLEVLPSFDIVINDLKVVINKLFEDQ